ncbi:MAG: MCE family protein [Caulobacteraceae bacterium]|nr:MlaD family protein [Caulobacter sp.]RYF91575.1 MAG: MCE family protein [Caulobacteraceae bacterium]
MERNANYALVGAASLLLFIAAIVFVFWLARLGFNKNYDEYDVLFVGPVRGLTEGGEVHFNGIKVGDVSRIALDKRDPNRVIARVKVTSDVPIREDSYATLEPQGITGINYIQITAGDPAKRLLKDTVSPGEVPVIRTQRSALSDLLAGGGTVLTRTIEALDRINRVLGDENIKTFGAALDDLQAVTAEAREQKEILADARRALLTFQETARAYTALAKDGQTFINGDAKTAMANIDEAARKVDKAAADVSSVLTKLDGPVNDFATEGLPQLTSAISTLQGAAESLDRLVSEAEKSPQTLVGKPPAEKKKVKP